MKRCWMLLIAIPLLVACVPGRTGQTAIPAAVSPTPAATVPPTVAAAVPTATLTAAPPTATPVPTETPLPPATPTAVPSPTPELPGEGYVVEEEREIGAYAVQVWRNASPEGTPYDRIVLILRGGQPEARIDYVIALGEETGSDLTGEGNPDVVVRSYTGGAHCCFSTTVYDLGPDLRKVLETPLSNCDGTFEDLDGDGVAEFVTCDDVFAYAYCPFASSPVVQVVLQYDPARGSYLPASSRFPALYAEIVDRHLPQAESAQAGELGEWDGTAKCAVLPLVLDYLYTGQTEAAWSALGRTYTAPDAPLFWAEIVQAAKDSPLYGLDPSSFVAPLPAYYMLELAPGCQADQMQHVVSVLQEGQAACDPDVPRRDLYWLQLQLQHAGLLQEDEMLLLAPEDCQDDCRLDVVPSTDQGVAAQEPQGIRLDVAGGFPGEVYRIDGQESDHWRLRGDLTWEPVPR
jgi:hypothetical protein